MKCKSSSARVALLLILLFFVASCFHEPIPTCNGVEIKLEIIATNTDPDMFNGSLVVIANGPAKFFTYSLNDSEFQASNKFTNLDSGVYTVTAKNSWGCLVSKEIKLEKTDPCAGILFTTTITNSTLGKSSGSITGVVSGDVTGYSYNINSNPFQTSNAFNGLAPGNYTVSAKNSNGCIFVSQATVGETDPCAGLAITVMVTSTNPVGNQSNGSITASVPTGAGFSYSLNGGTFQSSGIFSALAAGTYSVTAKNADGCIGTAQAVLSSINVCSGVTIAVTATTTDPTINLSNGSIVANATGGTGFAYSLNNGAFQSSGTFTGLAAGNYSITAKTSTGCTGSTQVLLNSINPCTGINVLVTTTFTNPTLNQSDGTLSASATGGSGFTYSLNGGIYQSTGVFTGLASGNYTITAKNSVGCIGVTQIAIGSTNPCAGVTVAVTGTVVSASVGQLNGSITLAATGGTGFVFNLNNGIFQTNGAFTALAAGNYTATAKNSNGCLGSSQFTVGSVDPCAGVTVAITGVTTNTIMGQSTGSIVATASGGTGFTFSLNNGAYQASGTFSSLATGNYTITAKNSNGCIGSAQFTVGSTDPCAGVTVAVTGVITNAATGQANGSITASASGGSGFTFSINGGTYQSSATFSGLAAGNYIISAKNSNGCLGSAPFTVATTNLCANTTISITSTTVASNNCVTPGTGSITATATGSTGFTYNQNNGVYQSSSTFSNLSPGNYTIGVKDVNGCTSTSLVTVGTVPAGATFSAVKVLIQSRCSGSGCHTNGQTQKGYNFDTDCKIVNAWSGINGSTITGTLNKMPIPPQPNLTAAEKQIIINWINAGHGFNN